MSIGSSSVTLDLIVATGLAVGGVDTLTGFSTAVRVHPTSAARGGLESRSQQTLFSPTASGGGFSAFAPELPRIEASGTGYSGVVTQPPTGALSIIAIEASGTVSAVVGSTASLPGVTAAGVGLAGELGVSQQELEEILAASYGGAAAEGVSAQVLPYILGEGSTIFPVGDTFAAAAIHTGTRAGWRYTNYPFNSFTRFNGKVLAAGQAGIFSLEGDDDDGVAIDAFARTGVSDFGTAYRKKFERFYVGYRATQDLVLRVYTDGVHTRDYRIPANLQAGIHGAHVRLGKGLEARYWQFEVRNTEGHTFSFDTIEGKPTKLSRRIGGNDA